MKKLFEYFDSVFFINLKDGKKRFRRKKLIEKFNLLEDSIERVEAIKYKKNRSAWNMGCGMSHKKCIYEAKKLGSRHVLNLEDDVDFLEDMSDSCINDIINYLNNNQWEYFCGSYIFESLLDNEETESEFLKHTDNGRIKMINDNLIEFTGVELTSACMVAYNNIIYDKFLQYPHSEETMDRWNTVNFKVIAPFPAVVFQQHDDKRYIHKKKISEFNKLVREYLL